MLRKLLSKRPSGFTLIEVVIVLAIAGLIFVIVFLAVSQAQASRRDTQRKNDANRIGAALEQYASNNQGNLPSEASFDAPSGSWNTDYWSKLNMNDPGSGSGYTPQVNFASCASGAEGTVYYDTTNRVYTLVMCLEKGSYSVTNQ